MLTVTAYNVGFGDALLVEFPDRHEGRTTMRRILIDMGNVLAGQGGPDRVFRAVAKDVRARLGGGAIDLFVMSHEHLDHVRGLPYLASVGLEIPVDYAWLTASANPRYGQRYPKAQAQRLALAAQVTHLGVAARALAIDGRPVRAFLENNNPFDTRACVDFLSGIARIRRCYVHSRFTVVPGKHHPFHEARLSIWAPEPNTLTYYGRFLPRIPQSLRRQKYPATPPGVDTKAFRALIRSMQSGLGENMLAIDRAANNTSIVLCLEWRGWRLLFTGDAERRSWLEMAKRRLLRPVHFLKVSHHGSHNGTPDDEILDAVFPEPRPDDRSRSVLLSTCPDTYNGVPDDTTIARITARVDVVRSTRSVPLGDSVKLEFPDRA